MSADRRPAASPPAPDRQRPEPASSPPAAGQPSAAPGMLRWLEELVNTRSIETGRDEIATPGLLGSWLRDRRLLPAGVPVTAEEHDRAVRIREGLRELIAANNAGPAAGDSAQAGDSAAATDSAQPSRHPRRDPRGPARASLAGLARRLPLVLDLEGSQPRLMPLSRGTAAVAQLHAPEGRRGGGRGQRHLGPAEDLPESRLPVGLL